MKRWVAFGFWFAIPIGSLFPQESPPDAGSFEVEPPILVLPDGRPVAQAEPSPIPSGDAAQLEKQLDRAKKSAASAERLYTMGVLAKVEAEQRALRVVRLQAELTKVQLAELQKTTTASDSMVQVQQPVHAEMKLALAQAATAAQSAAQNLAKAELDAAILNLHRQQKLLALGSGRKSDVQRAEEKLATLKQNTP